ncbi:MAG: hypothetical protein AB7P76_01625 [Candidatus Melainabacteria bacterium]
MQKPLLHSFLCLCLLAGQTATFSLPAEAKKAKQDDGQAAAAAAEAELKKQVDPIAKELDGMMTKLQSRALFSPTDAGKLADIKYKLTDLISQYPDSPMIVRPVFQAATLFAEREEFLDAYELYNFLASGFAAQPYGMRSKVKLEQLKKELGADYFPKELADTYKKPENTDGTTTPADPAKKTPGK